MAVDTSNLLRLARSEIDRSIREIDGKVLTRPALLTTDGIGTVYAVDVDIGASEILRSVPIARANRDLFYADAGSPCRLRCTVAGQWEVVGFSREKPGTYTRVAVTVPPFQLGPASDTTFGAAEDISIDARPLTLGELDTYGGFGVVPLGAIGIFRGGTLQELR
jgi:hypothetical protein